MRPCRQLLAQARHGPRRRHRRPPRPLPTPPAMRRRHHADRMHMQLRRCGQAPRRRTKEARPPIGAASDALRRSAARSSAPSPPTPARVHADITKPSAIARGDVTPATQQGMGWRLTGYLQRGRAWKGRIQLAAKLRRLDARPVGAKRATRAADGTRGGSKCGEESVSGTSQWKRPKR